jgi:hypothetical protein
VSHPNSAACSAAFRTRPLLCQHVHCAPLDSLLLTRARTHPQHIRQPLATGVAGTGSSCESEAGEMCPPTRDCGARSELTLACAPAISLLAWRSDPHVCCISGGSVGEVATALHRQQPNDPLHGRITKQEWEEVDSLVFPSLVHILVLCMWWCVDPVHSVEILPTHASREMAGQHIGLTSGRSK